MLQVTHLLNQTTNPPFKDSLQPSLTPLRVSIQHPISPIFIPITSQWDSVQGYQYLVSNPTGKVLKMAQIAHNPSKWFYRTTKTQDRFDRFLKTQMMPNNPLIWLFKSQKSQSANWLLRPISLQNSLFGFPPKKSKG